MTNTSTIFALLTTLILMAIILIGANTERLIVTDNILASYTPTPIKNEDSFFESELQRAIEGGKIVLRKSASLKVQGNKKEVALAIFDKTTHNVTEHRYILDDATEKFNGIVSLTPLNKKSPVVEISYWNGYNSTYEVASPSGAIVVANKYPVRSSILGALPERKKSQYSDIVYVPFSDNLNNSKNIESGESYLNSIVDKAYSDLDKKGIKSITNPEELITAQVPKELVKSIILIEHIDPSSFLTAPDGGRSLLDRVFAILGTNKESAYRYSISPAGASGISQFIRPTYASMVSTYPGAKLIKDYTLGTTDHINAVKAMICFFDIHIDQIRKYISNNENDKPLHLTEEMLAATYNGGPFRVSRAISQHGMAWIYSQLDAKESQKIFPQETIDYVRKYSAIRNILK